MASKIALASLLCFLWLPLGSAGPSAQTASMPAPQNALLEDFESYDEGGLPTQWKYLQSRELHSLTPRFMRENERFYIAREGSNQFVRAYTRGEATRIVLLANRGDGFDWSLEKRPRLQWEWRARKLPEGASEKSNATNDTGAAVYVTFGKDWLGRPKSIKYTYSSTEPVGTVASYGPLRVLVVDSGAEPGMGRWQTVQRDVAADYRQLFDGEPPDQPVSITIWSDSDTLGGEAEVDFDDFRLLPPRR